MAKFALLFVISFLLPNAAISAPRHAPASKAALAVSAPQKAAAQWLALVDAGIYDKSWQNASTAFKAAITQEQWMAALHSVREPLGAVRHRQFKTGKRTKTLPGAPDGDYAVLTYSTVFAKKTTAVETVILSHESADTWHVAGYFIR